MKKQLIVVLSVGVAAFLLSVMSAAAQGRGAGQGQGASAAGVAGTHEPMGMGSAMGGHEGVTAANNSTSHGPKTPDELLTPNSKLSDNLTKLLPNTMTPQQACQNFKNLGQCVAAIHVAKNLGIDFSSLACDMTLKPVAPAISCPTGTGTGTRGISLGASIQTLDPTLTKSSVNDAAKTGQKQAESDLSQS